jgi:uncharacterized protein (TIGR02466 family)
MPTHPLFASPLYVNPYAATENNLDIDSINQRLLKLEWEKVQNPDPNYVPRGTTSVNKDILKLPEFSDVASAIQNEMQKFVFDDLGIDPRGIKLHCNRSWSMYHERGDYSRPHCHENCLWSGILYTQVPDKAGGLTLFQWSSHYTWILPAIRPRLRRTTGWTANEMDIGVQPGWIVIFPAFIQHGTPICESDDPRLNVVFNYTLKGIFGDDYYDYQEIH